MTSQDFFDRTCIAAMQVIMKENNDPPDRVATLAKTYAVAMLKTRGELFFCNETDLEQHIMEVDENHGQILVEQDNRIEQLTQTVANLQRVIEQNCPGWINTPALYGNEHP